MAPKMTTRQESALGSEGCWSFCGTGCVMVLIMILVSLWHGPCRFAGISVQGVPIRVDGCSAGPVGALVSMGTEKSRCAWVKFCGNCALR